MLKAYLKKIADTSIRGDANVVLFRNDIMVKFS